MTRERTQLDEAEAGIHTPKPSIADDDYDPELGRLNFLLAIERAIGSGLKFKAQQSFRAWPTLPHNGNPLPEGFIVTARQTDTEPMKPMAIHAALVSALRAVNLPAASVKTTEKGIWIGEYTIDAIIHSSTAMQQHFFVDGLREALAQNQQIRR